MCVLECPHPEFDKIHIQLYSTVHIRRVAVHLFRVQTSETTFDDMTLGCAKMWVAHMEFHT